MDVPDMVNGAFESVGSVFVWLNVRQILRDRDIRGVYWPVTAFFAVWGVWNLYYYPSLEQWASFWAGVALCAGNVVWVVLAVRLILKRRRHNPTWTKGGPF